MKYLITGFLILWVSCAALAQSAPTFAQSAPTFPAPIGFVNDFEHDFSKPQLQMINDAVRDLLRMSIERDYPRGMEIAIVSVNDSMFGAQKDISVYAQQLFDKWGVGGKETNNGLLIAFSKERSVVTIITGDRLQRVLPEEVCKEIVDQKMITQFRKNEYVDGVLDAINSIATMLGLKGHK